MLRLEKEHWDLLTQVGDPVADRGHSRSKREGAQRDLQRAGLARVEPRSDEDGRHRLYRFAKAEVLVVDVFFTSGVCLAMTNIDFGGEDQTTTASGSGFTAEAAVLSCLGEAVELRSWMFRESDRVRVLRDSGSATLQKVSARGVLGFSRRQIDSRERLNRVWDGWDRIPPAAVLENPQFWTEVSSFDGNRSAICPSFLCFGRFGDALDGDATLNVDSNGCAAGPTPATARLKAVLELVERDATGIWWDRGCVRPRLDAIGTDPILHKAITQYREEARRQVWFLEISSFVNASVVAAVSCEADGTGLALGFGAALDRRNAARSAFLEVVQSEIAIEAHQVRAASTEHSRRLVEDRRTARWLRSADIRNFQFAAGALESVSSPDTNAHVSLADLLDEIRGACGEVWFVDLTRPELAVPTVKAICEGLAHYKLRRGSPRYTELPRLRGWQTTRTGHGRNDPRRLLI